MMTLVYFAICLGILVFVHELGHFLAARRVGVRVEEFSIGFGPRLFGWRRGDTDYRISLLPLGGFVRMLGEDPDDPNSKDPRAFASQSVWRRMQVVLAGPLMNLLLAFLVMPLALAVGRATPSQLAAPAVIAQVLPNSPAAAAGIAAGDRVESVDGHAVDTWGSLLERVIIADGAPVTLGLQRGDERITLQVTPMRDEASKRPLIGVIGQESTGMTFESVPFPQAIVAGFHENIKLLRMTGEVLKRLVTFQLSYKVLGGPVAIAKTSAAAAESGVGNFLYFMCFLSLQLFLLNLLPIPVLDGGHLVFFVIEMITRRPVHVRVRMIASQIGLALLLLLMVAVTINDVERTWQLGELWRKWFQ